MKEVSQCELARRRGTNQATLSRLEANRLLPNGFDLYRIGHHLGVSVDYLFGRTENPHAYIRPTLADLGDALLEPHPDDRERVMDLLRRLTR